MCCFPRKRPSTTRDGSSCVVTAPFASGRSACAERTDTIELVRPEHSVSFDAHSTRTCDTPEQIMERVGGRHVIPYPEEDGWREGLDWRDELDNEELTTPDYHKNLEACWDKEFESFAGRRDRAPNADKDTLPGGTEKPNALAQTDVGRHATPQAKLRQQRALLPSHPSAAHPNGYSSKSTTRST